MQILMTKAAYGRVAERLAQAAPDAEVVTAVGEDAFELEGQPIAAEDIAPEVVWLSLDSYQSGTLRPLYSRLMKSPAARWTQIMAAGIDNPMFRSIMEKGVRISKSSAQATPIAEYVVAHALSLQAPISQQAALQAKHEWKSTPYRELGHTRWLMCGFGNIGHEIARRIKPFGVHLTVVRRTLAQGDDLADRVITLAEIGPELPQADVVVLACALNDETRNMCDAAFFAAMKPGAILINIGRGGLVDEDALIDALTSGQLFAAGLDVFRSEPDFDMRFAALDNVILTPHIGSGSVETRNAMGFRALDNIASVLAGSGPIDPLWT